MDSVNTLFTTALPEFNWNTQDTVTRLPAIDPTTGLDPKPEARIEWTMQSHGVHASQKQEDGHRRIRGAVVVLVMGRGATAASDHRSIAMKNAAMIGMDLENVVGKGMFLPNPGNVGVGGPYMTITSESYLQQMKSVQDQYAGVSYFASLYRVSVNIEVKYYMNLDPGTGKHKPTQF